MDLPPNKIRFLLLNGLTETDVKSASYIICAHRCKAGTYVGLTKDPVKRWQEHFSNAFNEHYRDYDDSFREAIRGWKHNFEHYILAIAQFEKAAKNKEAFCIQKHGEKLNMKNEMIHSTKNYDYRPIDNQIVTPCILSKKTKSQTSFVKTDADRETVVGIVYKDSGRKRLKIIKGQVFSEGMNISCSKEELSIFNYGDKIKIRVSETSRRGTKFLKAAMSASLILVKE